MIKRGATYYWLIFLVLVTFTISAVPIARDVAVASLAPIIISMRRVAEPLWSAGQVIVAIPTLARENGELRARINELTALEATNREILHENDLLRKELSLSPHADNSLIAAQVISRVASVSQQEIVVNKGRDDGFKAGMAVLAQGYLIGRVTEVNANTSRITLITSPQSLLPVVLQNSRAVGLMRGGPEGLVITEIPRDVTITKDESLVSANLGDVIKSGIPVGAVSAVLSTDSDVFQSARIHSPVDLSRLEVVFGVK